jgi:chaperonin cofactor prefoldin
MRRETKVSVQHVNYHSSCCSPFYIELPNLPTEENERRNGVEQQLESHQKEINLLHQTNAELMEKLNQMTVELQELKASKTAVGSEVPGSSQTRRVDNEKVEANDELTIASELLELELKQLRETKSTFNKVIQSLQAKSADLELLEQWCDPEQEVPEVMKRSSTPHESRHSLGNPEPEVGATGGAVNVQVPIVVPGHYAESEAGVVESSSRSLHKSISDNALGSDRRWSSVQ